MALWSIAGELKAKDPDSTASLAEYRVELLFRRKAKPSGAEDTGEPAAGELPAFDDRAATHTDDEGAFELTIPDESELVGPTARLAVAAPSGKTVGDTEISFEELHDPLTFLVAAPDPVTVTATDPAESASTLHVSGQVIDPTGKALAPGIQLTIVARRDGGGADGAPWRPILATKVDPSGKFFGDVPNVEYTDAVAIVPGADETIPVPLDDGRIARRMLLAAEFSEEAPASVDGTRTVTPPRTPTQADIELAPETYSVDLGLGRCIDFNTPNRALEEFDFYSVVRTTEPDVRPVTLPGDERLSAQVPTAVPSGNGSGSLTAVRYDVRLATRGFADPGDLRVSFVTESGDHMVVAERAVAATGTRTMGGARARRPVLLEGAGGEDDLRAAPVSRQSWSVTDEGDTEVIGLDLRSIRRVEVEPIDTGSEEPWALVGIGITATTETGERVPILIEGAEAYSGQPWIQKFPQTNGDLARWDASAEVRESDIPAVRRMAATAGTAPLSDHIEIDAGRWQQLRESMFAPALTRTRLSWDNPVDWDSTPTLYEAATVAHGHLLHFKQVWYADGYSLGDLLYSLPLAPGQKKLVSVVDWERRETTARTELTTGREGLEAFSARDRDLGEVVTGALTESVKGGSRNTTTGAGVGTGAAGNGTYQGMNFGALLGVSGGYGDSVSNAWQDSGRALSTGSLQNLRDNTLQSASAVRSTRSSVVQTVSQGESTRVTTEVVANHNHCHALTVQYFEVLRHLKVAHELADVRECLFVPLPIAPFDLKKVLRWRQSLETYLTRPELAPAFDAVRRVDTGWSEVDYPTDRYADEKVTSISGELELTIVIPLPPLPPKPVPRPEDTLKETADAIKEATNPAAGFLGVLTAIATGGASLIANQVTSAAEKATQAAIQGARATAEDLLAQASPEAQYEKFQHEVMPGVAAGFVDQLELYARVGGSERKLDDVDFTLVSDYRPGVPLLVSVKANPPADVSRADIRQLRIKSKNGLPPGCRAIVNTATFRYGTRSFEHAVVDDRRTNDDIDLPVVQVSFSGDPLTGFTVTQLASGNGAAVSTPLDAWELRNPRIEDGRLAATLIDHLNEQLEFYHQAIWWTMDPNRRYMLLDGFLAPNSGDRSVASVVENKLIGIVGNSLVLPVAEGVQLDPRIKVAAQAVNGDRKRKPAALTSLYPADPVPAARVSLPTRGVFAEAVMGNCNACETIDDSRFWRWEESPIDEPPAIEPASTATRRSEPATVTPTPFPTPMISMQTPASAPDPAGVAAALAALGKESFADITGLAGTQANAAAAYSKALETALAFGKEASTLAQQASAIKSMDKTMAKIDKAEADKKIGSEDAERHRNDLIDSATGATGAPPKTSEVKEKLETLKGAEEDGAIDLSTRQKYSDVVAKHYVGDETPPPTEDREAGAEVIKKVGRRGRVKSVETPDAKVTTHSGPAPLDPPEGLIPKSYEELVERVEEGAKLGEILLILANAEEYGAAWAPRLLATVGAAESIFPLVGAIASVAYVWIEIVNALDTGLRSDETMGWVYGITNAIDGKPGPTELPPLDQPRDTEAARRARFDAGVERGRALILEPSTDEERRAAAELKIWLALCIQDKGVREGHKQFVTALFRLAYKDGDQQHRETWYADWPEMRAAPGPIY